MEPIFKCPVCNGRLAFWAVRAEFVCPHCELILSSNRAEAFTKAVWVALAIETLLFSILYFLFDSLSMAIAVWGGASGVVGYWASWVAIKRFMIFRAVRTATHSPPTSAGG